MKLDYAMKVRMKEIVLIEHRPFCYLDFEDFTVKNKHYHIAHGTFRNKISELLKNKDVELEYNSKISFYTLPGIHFGNDTVTRNHMGNTSVISVTDLVKFIEDLPLDKRSIHDIHMKFQVPDIWKIVSLSKKYSLDSVSKDIRLQPLITDSLKIQTTIHHTDTVSVIVGCSYAPVVIEEVSGIIRLSNALTRVEERLSRVVDGCGENLPGGYERIPIPDNGRWMVTLWHFGRDSKVEYSGQGFAASWGYGREALLRVYSKDNSNIRIESQESPNKTVGAIRDRIVHPDEEEHRQGWRRGLTG